MSLALRSPPSQRARPPLHHLWPFSLPSGREQVADRWVLTCYDSWAFTVPSRNPSTSREVYGRDWDLPTRGSPARKAEDCL